MLKKAMLGVVLGLTVVPAAAMAAGKGPLYRVTVQENGKTVLTQTLAVLPGNPAYFESTKTISYMAKSVMNSAGATNITPESLTTGVSGELNISRKVPNVVNINITDSRLMHMGAVVGDGQTIVVPDVAISTFQDSIAVLPGYPAFIKEHSTTSGKIRVTIQKV